MEACPTCVLLEVQEGIKRSAFFVHARPDCRIEVSQLNIEGSHASDDGIVIFIDFDLRMDAKIKTCLGVSSSSFTDVVATIEGEFLGSGSYVKEDASLTLFGGEALRGLGNLKETKP